MRLPEGADRGVAGEAMRCHAAAVRAQGFHHAVAEAGTAHTRLQPNGAPASGPAPAALIPPIAKAYAVGSLQLLEFVETDLEDVARVVKSGLADANEKLERIDVESARLKARRGALATELEGEQQHAAAAALGSAQALLEGDQAQRAKRTERRTRAQAAVGEITYAIKLADQRIESLRIERITADEQCNVWGRAVADLTVLQLAPSLIAKLNDLLAEMNLLDGSRIGLMSQYLSAAVAGKGAAELSQHFERLASRLEKLVRPLASAAKVKEFAPADTVITCNRSVEYEKDTRSTHTIPAGATALVPAHVARRIVALGAGALPSQPAKVEILATSELQVGDGSVPRGRCIFVAKSVADEL